MRRHILEEKGRELGIKLSQGITNKKGCFQFGKRRVVTKKKNWVNRKR